MADKLRSGDTFPSLALNLTDGTTVTLPQDISTEFAVVILYRGHW